MLDFSSRQKRRWGFVCTAAAVREPPRIFSCVSRNREEKTEEKLGAEISDLSINRWLAAWLACSVHLSPGYSLGARYSPDTKADASTEMIPFLFEICEHIFCG